ncbi:MAG: DUF3467 domain-containing protein [Patescibacteria group bacterium]|nr:DUF3467 domain-containing protein [Patescibacteria group bacterium]
MKDEKQSSLKKPQKKTIHTQVSGNVLKGSYSNAFKMNVTDNEAYIDFAFIFEEDGNQQAEVFSRIILRPEFARNLGQVIVETIDKHQKKNEKSK